MNPSVKGICKLMFKTCKNFHFRELLLQREEFIIMCYPCIQSSSEILGCFFFCLAKIQINSAGRGRKPIRAYLKPPPKQ